MVKTSIIKQMVILFIYALYGVGIGGIVSASLYFGKVLPDTMGYAFLVIVPIALLYILFRVFNNFNKVTIDSTNVIVTSFLGKKTMYPYSGTEFVFADGGYKIYSVTYLHILHMATIDTVSQKTKEYQLAPYDDKQIPEIINLIESNSSKN